MKRNAPAILMCLIIVLGLGYLFDRYFMTVYWDGTRQVQVRFDAAFQTNGARILKYDNFSYKMIEIEVRSATQNSRGAFGLTQIPETVEGATILDSRIGGTRSLFHDEGDNWVSGFVAEVANNDGQTYLAWTEAAETSDGYVATFTMGQAVPIKDATEKRLKPANR